MNKTKEIHGKGGLRTPDLTVISRALYQAKPLSLIRKFSNNIKIIKIRFLI